MNMFSRVAVFGEALFDLLQQADNSFQPFIGGSPYNVARSFVRQDLKCTYLSPISTDDLGQRIYQSALSDGIDLPDNMRSEKNTSLALVYEDPQGKPSYRLYRKGVADLDVTQTSLLSALPDDLTLFHTGSLALVPGMVDVLLPVLEILKKRGVKISIDVNVRKGVEESHQQYVTAIWQFMDIADIVKVSDEDLSLMGLSGDPEIHCREILTRMKNGIVVLTLGEHGSQIITKSTHLKQGVIKPTTMGDTVGAGDTYFSALIAYLLKRSALSSDASPELLAEALRFGAMAASLNVEHIGCHPPTSQQVVKRLGKL